MRIAEVATSVVALPADEPLADAPNNPGGTRPLVTLALRTDQGIEGIGLTFLGGRLTRSLRHATQALAELAIGEEAGDIEGIRSKLYGLAGGSGPAGIYSLALSAIDIALWDIKGKAEEAPLWKLLGAPGKPVPCYASGALMRELSLDAAVTAAGRLAQKGFSAMKFQLGLPGALDPEAEIERARLIRDAAGPEARLMCDVNQRWSLDDARRLGRRLEPLDLTWIEDPIAFDDVDGLAELTRSLNVDIAAGEYLYGLSEFRQMLQAQAFEIVMVDPFRAGGISGWLKAAALADQFGKRVVSHLAPEIQLHLIDAIPNGRIVEYMPWFNGLYEEVVWPENGMLAMPESPGLGVRFDKEVLARHTVEQARS